MSALLEPLECPLDDAAHVPRRFGAGVMLILMTAFAVLFAFMRTFGAPPEVFVVVAGLFLAVTLAQILLFQGNKPREASALAGAVIFPLEIIGVILWTASHNELRGTSGGDLFASLVCSVPGGALLGYVAGCVMAGVFFVQENFGKKKASSVEIKLLPLADDDCSTLCSWLHHRQLFDLWSQGQFSYPLDEEQLHEHCAPIEVLQEAIPPSPAAELPAGDCPDFRRDNAAVGEAQQGGKNGTAPPVAPDAAKPPAQEATSAAPPTRGEGTALLKFLAPRKALERLAFKAVGGEMQQMVAVAELAEIDRDRSRANIEMAIVDPTREDRPRISNKLLRGIVEEAFDRQGLHWLRVVLPREAVQSQQCFRKLGFYDLESAALGPRSGYVLLVRGRRYE